MVLISTKDDSALPDLPSLERPVKSEFKDGVVHFVYARTVTSTVADPLPDSLPDFLFKRKKPRRRRGCRGGAKAKLWLPNLPKDFWKKPKKEKKKQRYNLSLLPGAKLQQDRKRFVFNKPFGRYNRDGDRPVVDRPTQLDDPFLDLPGIDPVTRAYLLGLVQQGGGAMTWYEPPDPT
jgi:hypothetical protein